MPRRNDPRKARSIQVCVAVRPEDREQWRTEAKAQGISLSRLIYIRARVNAPMKSSGELALARELGRIGINLNKFVKIMHSNGLNPDVVAEALAVVWQIQERLVLR